MPRCGRGASGTEESEARADRRLRLHPAALEELHVHDHRSSLLRRIARNIFHSKQPSSDKRDVSTLKNPGSTNVATPTRACSIRPGFTTTPCAPARSFCSAPGGRSLGERPSPHTGLQLSACPLQLLLQASQHEARAPRPPLSPVVRSVCRNARRGRRECERERQDTDRRRLPSCALPWVRLEHAPGHGAGEQRENANPTSTTISAPARRPNRSVPPPSADARRAGWSATRVARSAGNTPVTTAQSTDTPSAFRANAGVMLGSNQNGNGKRAASFSTAT